MCIPIRYGFQLCDLLDFSELLDFFPLEWRQRVLLR